MHAPIESAAMRRLRPIVDDALRQIPPLWPLDSSVAVNPFLGQSRERLAEAATRLGRLADAPVTMPRGWFKARIDGGEIIDADLAAALAASPHASKPSDPAELKHAAARSRPAPQPLPTIADLAADATGTDWPGIIADRIGAWAGSYFDAGQALWVAPREIRVWRAYRIYATHDVTPEILGLSGFAAFVAAAPEDPEPAIARAADTLGLSGEALGRYLHQLLLTLGGWAQYGRYRHWRAEQAQQEDHTPIDLLAIRLLWEEALFLQHAEAIGAAWADARAKHAEPLEPGKDDIIDELLQEAAERARQRRLADTLAETAAAAVEERPQLQAAFCIDVRSEVFRRVLESVDPGVRTLGFAGFFGVFVKHRRFASDVEEPRLPVLFRPTVSSCVTGDDNREADSTTRYRARARRAWGRFKLAAVSCFAFVEAMGPVYIPKLLRDALGRLGRPPADTRMPRFSPPLDRQARIDSAETVLRAMSLTDGFARLVLLVGHGANVVNDPQASALHCGACGGYPGEVNARLLAGLLNDPEVRDGLAERGIAMPDDTLFVAGLHDTTTDRVDLYETDTPATAHAADLAQLRKWLAEAGRRARGERALRLPRARRGRDIRRRARDWSETRPEWGLAGCSAFIAAPRARTRGRNLAGRAFLHEYDWKPDSANGFSVLELILTAPVVVASWISLQYYGSTVAPTLFGAGNKLLHNVVGGIGVFEGNGGLLRAGLARQSVHDGERHIHEPLRLTVCVEAPRAAMTDILRRHEDVRAVFDKGWLHLFALDENGRPAWRYAGDLDWTAEPPQRHDDHGLRAVS